MEPRDPTLVDSDAEGLPVHTDRQRSLEQSGRHKAFPALASSRPENKEKAGKHRQHSKTRTRKCRYGHACRNKDACRLQHPQEQGGHLPSSSHKNHHPPGVSGTVSHKGGRGAGRRSGRGRGGRTGGRGCPPKHCHGGDGAADPNKPDVGFYLGPLNDREAQGYKAAGILVARRSRHADALSRKTLFEALSSSASSASSLSRAQTPQSPKKSRNNNNMAGVQVLLCAEDRNKKKKSKSEPMQLNFIGGKIELDDSVDARNTAAREFWEETGQLLDRNLCNQLVGIGAEAASQLTCSHEPIWCGPGKYALYVATIGEDDDLWDTLAHQYDRAAASGTLPPGSEPRYLVWVDWEQLCHNRSFRVLVPAPKPSPSEQAASTQELTLLLSKFAGPVCGNAKFQGFVNSLLNNSMGGRSEAASEALETGKGDQMQDLSAKVKGMKVEE